MANTPELAALLLAATHVGLTLAPLSPDLSQAEAAFALADAPADALIVSIGVRKLAARDAAEALRLPVLELTPSRHVCGLFKLASGGVGAAATHRAVAPSAANPTTSRDSIALLLHTSGTTRRPKLVPLSHGQLGLGALHVASTLRLGRDDVCVNVMPLFHLHAIAINLLVSAVCGSVVECAPSFDGASFVARLADEPAPTWYSAVPTIHQEVARAARTAARETSAPPRHKLTLARNCSAALPPIVAAALEEALPGLCVLTTYAMTEALPICSNPRPVPGGTDERDLGSVGPAAGPSVAIRTADGAEAVSDGAEGEVCVRGDCVFRGYEPRAHLGFDPNESAFTRDGWFRTGDKGRMDARGHLHLTGRFKEVINRAGEKISPLTVEHALLAGLAESDGAVGEVSLLAFAMPHEELGETVGVAATCDSARTVTIAQIRRAGARGKLLSRRWLPEVLVLLPKLPKGPTGKPQRIGLAEALGLVPISVADGMVTMDRRRGDGQSYEVAERSLARKEAKSRERERREAARSSGRAAPCLPAAGHHHHVAAVPAASGPWACSTLDECVALVAASVLDVSGASVEADDDLFDAGLASISAARLRELLAERTGLELPHNVAYEFPVARLLAVAILRLRRATTGSKAAEQASDAFSLAGEAAEALRKGQADEAEALAERVVEASGLFCATDPVHHAHNPLLVLLISVWWRQGRLDRAAMAVERKLRAAAARRGGEEGPSVDAHLLGSLLTLLLRRTHQLDAATEAAAAAAAASAAMASTAAPWSPDAAAAVSATEELVRRNTPLDCAQLAAEGAGCTELLRGYLASPTPRAPPYWCGHCANMTTLVLRRLGLRELPPQARLLLRLRVLDAADNTLVSLGEAPLSTTLRELLLPNNELRGLPAWLPTLKHLSVLNVQGNRMERLPNVVLHCRQVSIMRWGAQKGVNGDVGEGDGAAAAPVADTDACFTSAQLRVLELEANELEALPRTCEAHSDTLVALLASFNRLGHVPALVQLHSGSLKKLHLGCNGIRSLDGSGLGELRNLAELCLEGNRLTALPDEVGRLRKLRELWLHGNQLDELPEALGDCEALTVLQAHHNRLTRLPGSMRKLVRLQGLYLQSNRLRGSLAELRQRILDAMPLQNLGLGANQLDLAEAFALERVRIGLGWNPGRPPAHLEAAPLTDRFSITDHLYEPSSAGGRAPLLVVAFAAQGPGMQQWIAPCAAARAAGLPLDVLYLADPSNSYYLQDPRGEWCGVEHYAELIRTHSRHYGDGVVIVGSSMGATAALLHADLAGTALAFSPRVDIRRSHGTYVPPSVAAACLDKIKSASKTSRGSVRVHVGAGNAVDMMQVAHLRDYADSVQVIEHHTFHHNVPMFLEREGKLVALFKHTLAELLERIV